MDTDPTQPLSEEHWARLLNWVENTAPYLEGWDEWEQGNTFDPDLGREDKLI